LHSVSKRCNAAGGLAAARADARRMGIGWVLVWQRLPGVVRSRFKF
jgi:hypothetical protein